MKLCKAIERVGVPAVLLIVCNCYVFGHILRLTCVQYGNFTIVKQGYKLAGPPLKTYSNLNVEECEDECIEHRSCKSINTKNATEQNCELHATSTEDPFDNAVATQDNDWTYRATDYRARNIGYYCRDKQPCHFDMICTDTCTCPGYQCSIPSGPNRLTCQEAFSEGHNGSTVYQLRLPGQSLFSVRCDMETAGGGWIVFQRRHNESVSFDREWADYNKGFGDVNGNYWLGLEKLHMLAAPGKGAILRVDMRHRNEPHTWRHATYSKFEISEESDGYKLTVDGYSGDAGDSLTFQSGMNFSTKDNDQDTDAGNCALACVGGWWFKGAPEGCHKSFLNSKYPTSYQPNTYHMSWYTMYNQYGNVAVSEMKLRYGNV